MHKRRLLVTQFGVSDLEMLGFEKMQLVQKGMEEENSIWEGMSCVAYWSWTECINKKKKE